MRPNYFDGVAKYGLVAPIFAAGGDLTKIFACPKRFGLAVLVGCSAGVAINMMKSAGTDSTKKTVAENEYAHNVLGATRAQLFRSSMKIEETVRSSY